jgi:hypothetical protein
MPDLPNLALYGNNESIIRNFAKVGLTGQKEELLPWLSDSSYSPSFSPFD